VSTAGDRLYLTGLYFVCPWCVVVFHPSCGYPPSRLIMELMELFGHAQGVARKTSWGAQQKGGCRGGRALDLRAEGDESWEELENPAPPSEAAVDGGGGRPSGSPPPPAKPRLALGGSRPPPPAQLKVIGGQESNAP
jgi:hypothetical protein